MLILSISLLTTIFDKLPDCENWSLQLLRINNSKKNGISYATRQIELTPDNKLHDYVWNISKRYTKGKDSFINTFDKIVDYDGSIVGNVIYKLDVGNILINEAFKKLKLAIANPDVESEPLKFDASAYLIKGQLNLDDKDINIKLFSMNKPLTTLKNKYSFKFWEGPKFEEITNKVLSLRNSFDAIITDENIYFLNFTAEKLFNLEHVYHKICSEKVDLICQKNIISSPDEFKKIATSGHNPRRFISFNANGLTLLQDEKIRNEISKKFSLSLKDDKFDTSDEDTAKKLVKVLCKKGMLDPFDDVAVEVENAKKWN